MSRPDLLARRRRSHELVPTLKGIKKDVRSIQRRIIADAETVTAGTTTVIRSSAGGGAAGATGPAGAAGAAGADGAAGTSIGYGKTIATASGVLLN